MKRKQIKSLAKVVTAGAGAYLAYQVLTHPRSEVVDTGIAVTDAEMQEWMTEQGMRPAKFPRWFPSLVVGAPLGILAGWAWFGNKGLG